MHAHVASELSNALNHVDRENGALSTRWSRTPAPRLSRLRAADSSATSLRPRGATRISWIRPIQGVRTVAPTIPSALGGRYSEVEIAS